MSNVTPLFSEQPLRVLTADLSARLTAANDARRALSERGHKVVAQDIHAKSRPLLRLAHGSEQLRTELLQIAVIRLGVERYLVGRFLDVDVAWPMEASH